MLSVIELGRVVRERKTLPLKVGRDKFIGKRNYFVKVVSPHYPA